MVTLTCAPLTTRGGISFDCQDKTYTMFLGKVESFVSDLLLETSDKSLLVFSRVVLSRSAVSFSSLSSGGVDISSYHLHRVIDGTLSVKKLLEIVRCENGISNDAFSELVDNVLKKREEGKAV
jgi:hypothetical protein